MDRKELVTILPTDMSKAFDSLIHSLTLKKLDAYGFNSSSLELISSIFDSRLNRVKINGHMSESRITSVVVLRDRHLALSSGTCSKMIWHRPYS